MSGSASLYQTIGIDVGGANIKIADASGRSAASPFALWKTPDQLGSKVREMLAEFPRAEALAVTLTGELADCYATRREGVRRILNQLAACIDPSQIHVYSVDGTWRTVLEAEEDPWSVAAANWSALAHWLCRYPVTSAACHSAVLLDIGSTTTDIIPIRNGSPDLKARTDRERMECGRLVYTGLSRTPVCAVVQSLTLRGRSVPVMAELFATIDDAYLVRGLVPEAPDDCDSADGRPRTSQYAGARLARMIGEDCETLDPHDIEALACELLQVQTDQIAHALAANLREEDQLLVTGHGGPAARAVIRQLGLEARSVMLADTLGPEAARCAPAVAVAWLWNHRDEHRASQGTSQ